MELPAVNQRASETFDPHADPCRMQMAQQPSDPPKVSIAWWDSNHFYGGQICIVLSTLITAAQGSRARRITSILSFCTPRQAVNRVDNDQCALRVRAEPRETARARSTLITAAQGSRARRITSILSFCTPRQAVNRVDNDQCALRVRAEPRETARARSTLITAAQGSRARRITSILSFCTPRQAVNRVDNDQCALRVRAEPRETARARSTLITAAQGSRARRITSILSFCTPRQAINRVDNGQRALRVRPEPCVRVPCVLDFAARQPDSLLLRIPADLAQVPTALDAPRLPRPSPIRRAGLTLCYVYCLASFSRAIRIPLSSPSAATSAAESNAHSMTTALLGIVAGTLALIVIIVVASVWLFTHRRRRARHPSRSRAPYPPTLRAGLPGVDRASPGIEAIRGEVGERVSSFALHPLRSSRPPQDFRSRSVRLAFLAKPSTQEPASQTRAHSALPAHGAKEAALARYGGAHSRRAIRGAKLAAGVASASATSAQPAYPPTSRCRCARLSIPPRSILLPPTRLCLPTRSKLRFRRARSAIPPHSRSVSHSHPARLRSRL
ncbi:hypothetical protein C8R44DRAFT_755135 [Mycena epipterygia]|nr:hypothetical protein C8R44DRAFT_755135 [Mycena epipterygia]